MNMYESPIQMIMDNIQTQMIQQEEDQLLMQVQKSLGFDIDKNELLRALKYDRDQYEKGYKDGQHSASWTPVSEGLPKMTEFYLTSIKWDNGTERVIISWFDGISFKAEVKAWMPLPAPYQGKENGHN